MHDYPLKHRTIGHLLADKANVQQWIADWGDLVEFEVVPVVSSEQTRETMLPRL